MRSPLLALVAAISLSATAPVAALAQTVVGDAGNGTSSGFSGAQPTDQTFTVPAGLTTLSAVNIGVGDAAPFTISLHRVVGGVVQPAIASMAFPGSPAVFPNYNLFGPALPAGGVSVTPGEQLLIRSTSATTVARSNYYAGGNAVFNGVPQSSDTYFTATFAAPASVPTMSEWAMILLALTLAGGAAVYLQRRRLTA